MPHPARHVVTGPPIMPSTQTRTKLKAFQFIEGAPSIETAQEREAEKENLHAATTRIPKAMETPKTTKVVKDINKTEKTPKPPSVVTCPPPSTPATTRLPLADLVGNIDDSSRHVPKPVTSPPEEQLIWRGSQPVNTPLPRKNKKRARSSSPVGPSQEDHRLDSGRRDLTTPQADPAMELWSRYTGVQGTPSASKGVAFAHLINEASPRSTAAAGSVSGLRRWASCGHEFPASNRKRRRTHGVFQGDQDQAEDVFAGAPSSDGSKLAQPPKSNIANMIRQIKEISHSSRSRLSTQQFPSSSSPLPGSGERHGHSSGSPLQRRAQEQSQEHEHEHETSEAVQYGEDPYQEENENVQEDLQAPDVLQRSFGSSDDFGDDDLDMDMVDALETPQGIEQQPLPPAFDILCR